MKGEAPKRCAGPEAPYDDGIAAQCQQHQPATNHNAAPAMRLSPCVTPSSVMNARRMPCARASRAALDVIHLRRQADAPRADLLAASTSNTSLAGASRGRHRGYWPPSTCSVRRRLQRRAAGTAPQFLRGHADLDAAGRRDFRASRCRNARTCRRADHEARFAGVFTHFGAAEVAGQGSRPAQRLQFAAPGPFHVRRGGAELHVAVAGGSSPACRCRPLAGVGACVEAGAERARSRWHRRRRDVRGRSGPPPARRRWNCRRTSRLRAHRGQRRDQREASQVAGSRRLLVDEVPAVSPIRGERAANCRGARSYQGLEVLLQPGPARPGSRAGGARRPSHAEWAGSRCGSRT